MISDEVGLAIMQECEFEDYTFDSPHNVSQLCNEAISEANRIVGQYVDNYDVILDVCYPSIVEQELRLRKMVFPPFISHNILIPLLLFSYFVYVARYMT